jgi:hypothetical protein
MTLTVTISRAQNLPRTDEGGRGKIDPYFQVKFAGQQYETRHLMNDLNPIYKESFFFFDLFLVILCVAFTFNDPPTTEHIVFELYDEEGNGTAKFIGLFLIFCVYHYFTLGTASVDSDQLPNGIVCYSIFSFITTCLFYSGLDIVNKPAGYAGGTSSS